MVNMKNSQIRMAKDGWTALAVDGLPSAHFEHTLLVDENMPEILTLPESAPDSVSFLEEKLGQISSFSAA